MMKFAWLKKAWFGPARDLPLVKLEENNRGMGKDPVRRVEPDRGKEASSHLSWAVVLAKDEACF